MGRMHDLTQSTKFKELVPAKASDGVSNETAVDMNEAMDGAYLLVEVYDTGTNGGTNIDLSLQDSSDGGSSWNDYDTISLTAPDGGSDYVWKRIESYDQHLRADTTDTSNTAINIVAGLIAPLHDSTK